MSKDDVIKDFLERTFQGPFQAMRIREWLKRRGDEKHSIRLLHSLIVFNQGDDIDRNFEIDLVVDTLGKLGVSTVGDLNNFVERPEQYSLRIANLIDPIIVKHQWEFNLRVETNLFAFRDAMKNSPLSFSEDFDYNPPTFDGYYKILPVGAGCLFDLFNDSKVKGTQYHLHKDDCEDKALGFMWEMARAGRGDYALRYAEFTIVNGDGLSLGRHAVNCSFHEPSGPTDIPTFWLMDPMTGRLWNDNTFAPMYDPEQANLIIDRVLI